MSSDRIRSELQMGGTQRKRLASVFDDQHIVVRVA